MKEAWKECKETLNNGRELAQDNPQTILPRLAKIVNNPRLLHGQQHRMERAWKCKGALKIDRERTQQGIK